MLHRFHNPGDPSDGQGSITSLEFEALLHFVGIENILPPEEWVSRLKDHKLRNEDLCLTFDDGLKCQYDFCLPILEKYHLRGFWFIYSSVFEGREGGSQETYRCFATRYFENISEFYELFLGRCGEDTLKKLEGHKFEKYASITRASFPFYSAHDLKFRFIRNEFPPLFEKVMNQMMKERGVSKNEISKNLWFSNAELKILSDKGHSIGLHSYDHPSNFFKLSYRDQLYQYRKNYEHIEGICRQQVVSMAHPLNSYNQNTLKVLRRLGILCGFRSNMTPPEGKRVNPNSLELAREDASHILKKLKITESGRERKAKAYASWN